ncbi:MAG TPA: DUF4351 domain-containing protein [Steroidobacteraceae bacterium]
MVSIDHEGLLELFRNQPSLAPRLLREALDAQLPKYSKARTEAADFTDIQPTEYRADLVVVLSDETPKLGIVVEVQLSIDERKRFTWPVYVATLRARLECAVFLLIVAPEQSVARWASQPIELGGGSVLKTWVLGEGTVPEVTDEEQARAAPELAVLSAMSYGWDADAEKAVRIAVAAEKAILTLDDDRRQLYFLLINASLSEAARQELGTMDLSKLLSKYEHRSEFVRHYRAQGRAEGRAEGMLAIVSEQLEARFGALPEDTRAQIAAASPSELGAIARKLLTAQSLQEALSAS